MKASKTVMVLPWRNGRALRRIAWHIVTGIPEFLSHFGLTIEMMKDSATVPFSAKEIAESFRKISDDAAEAVKQQWTDEFSKQVQNAFGRDWSDAAILSLLIKHIIHCRGQRTVLMRQAGLEVHGIYDSAKEEWSRMGQGPPAI